MQNRRVGAGNPAAEHAVAGAPRAFQTTDLARARAELCTVYYPLRIEPGEESNQFRFTMRTVSVGALTIGRLAYDTDITKDCGDLQTAYHVDIPIRGQVACTCGDQQVLSTPTIAAVFNPIGHTVLDRWTSGTEQLSLKISRALVEDELARWLDRAPRTPARFRMAIDLTSPLSRSWLHAVHILATELDTPGGLAAEPLLATELQRLIVGGLLHGQPNTYTELLGRPGKSPRPRTVKRAMDLIDDHPDHPWTATELADAIEISVRSLEEGFRRYVGISPLSYLRDRRLDRVHHDLQQGSVPQTTVTDVAYRWGFAHLGRFAEAYRRKFGVNPSDTLRLYKP